MLRLQIPAVDMWDEQQECFIVSDERTLCLEHSLVSLSKWESKWNKPFLSKDAKTQEETIDYIRCMTIGEELDRDVYDNLSSENIEKINKYINAAMTATTFSNTPGRGGRNSIITAEIIYHWMIALQIPSDYENWHLNRLMTLIRVCEAKNSPGKKMSKGETMRRQAQLNAARRQKLNSKG